MILSAFTAQSIAALKEAGIDNPSLDARLLIGHILGLDRAQLVIEAQRVLNNDEKIRIDGLLVRRLRHESVARIIGFREFWGLPFGLNEATLEPRSDSEILVEAVLKLRKESSRILDLGTGTGCLLLALLHEIPRATGIGIDINPRAIEQATKNAAVLGLNTRALFQQGDWLQGLNEKFDIIVSNPPYIPVSDIPGLMADVRDYDPMLALDGGDDGLVTYRLLIPQLARFLAPNGLITLEVGQGQAGQVQDLLQRFGFTDIATHKDLGGIERCVTATYPDN
jgi:release factor glutamine methyltransferase